MINNSITFFPGYCIYFNTLLSSILPKSKKTEIIFKAQYEDMVLDQILKQKSDQNLDNILKIIQKLLDKKKQLINASKQKLTIGKQKLKTIVLSSLNNLNKEDLIILTLTSIIDIDIVNVAIISANIYHLACKLKKAWVFAILIKNLKI